MSNFAYAIKDSRTMLRRNLKHAVRYPSITLLVMGVPIIFLLLFVYVFGGTLGAGLGGPAGGRDEYVNYVAPGILLLGIAGAVQGTAISVAMDMTEGIIARFRTMAVPRGAVLAGHAAGSTIQTMLGIGVVLAVAVLVGFRPNASAIEWLATLGVLLLLAIALTWLSVALGMVTKTVEAASNLPMPLMLMPFLGSGFVPTDTMPKGLQWFADYQPFTPAIETLRGLLLGSSIDNSAIITIAWCVGITAVSYVWAKRLFNRDPMR